MRCTHALHELSSSPRHAVTALVLGLALPALVAACGGSQPGAPAPPAAGASTGQGVAPAAQAPQVAAAPTIAALPTARPEATAAPIAVNTAGPTLAPTAAPTSAPHPLSIAAMRAREYPGSDITIEQTLAPGANYDRYVASYRSEGLKIYALLTVPRGPKPASGWPVVVFNHGFIPPQVYRTTERYIAYTDAFSRNGYIVFKSDYRGHGSSEGRASGGYGAPDYTVDVMNALASIQRYPDADPNRVGMWGHSMGGYITLRAMVLTPGIKAGVIWGGVVDSYPDMLFNWGRPPTGAPPAAPAAPPPGALPGAPAGGAVSWRNGLAREYGMPDQNPGFWASISANTYLRDLSGPLQLHHSVTDEEVPVGMSQRLAQQVRDVGGMVELYTYPGDDHNISANLYTALNRSVAWFDKYVKNG